MSEWFWRLNVEADALTAHWEELERRLKELNPGLEVSVVVPHQNDNKLMLYYGRIPGSGAWGFSIGTCPLRSCPLDLRILAVAAVPELLKTLHEMANNRTDCLRNANTVISQELTGLQTRKKRT